MMYSGVGASNLVQEDLSNSGFVCNMVKSKWFPEQVGEHLGFAVNFKDGTFPVKEKGNQN